MKKFLSAVLALSFVLCALLPAAALAAEPIVILAGVEMYPGDYLHVGASAVSAAAPTDGTGYAHVSADGKTLTLHDFDNQDKTYAYNYYDQTALFINEEISLKLEGANKLTATEADNEGIMLHGNLTIDESSTGSLTINADYAIYGSASFAFTMNGGSVVANSDHFGIWCESFSMTGGDLEINATRRFSLYCYHFKMTGGHLKAQSYENYYADTIYCDRFEMTGGLAEITSNAPSDFYPICFKDEFICTVHVADNVVVGKDGIYTFLDTDEAMASRENGGNAGRRTVVLGGSSSVPTTGDNAMIALWAALATFSAAGMIFISRRRAVK